MKVKVITSYKPGTWDEFAKRGIDSMAEQFPKEIDIVLYCEEPQPKNVNTRIKCIDLNTAEPELFNFKNKHKNDPIANGKLQEIPGGVRRSPDLQTLGGQDKNKESFLWDAVRFANKVFCIVNAVRNSTEYDYVLWLDADTFTFRPVPMDFFENVLPADTMLTYLGRENPTLNDGGVYPECGFVGYNLKHPETQNFINDWEQLYVTGNVFKILEWHDSFVFWHLSKIYRKQNSFFTSPCQVITVDHGIGVVDAIVSTILSCSLLCSTKQSYDNYQENIKAIVVPMSTFLCRVGGTFAL